MSDKPAGTKQLGFRVVYCSSHEPGFPASQLTNGSRSSSSLSPSGVKSPKKSRSQGWHSARFCEFPQTLVVRLDQVSQIKQVQLLSHQSKIASKVEIWVYESDGRERVQLSGLGSSVGSSESVRGGQVRGESGSRPTDVAADRQHWTLNTVQSLDWTRLGYLSLDKNERSKWKARELKSVYIDTRGDLFKLAFHESHLNKQNMFHQVAIVSLNIVGSPLFPSKIGRYLSNRATRESEMTGNSDLRGSDDGGFVSGSGRSIRTLGRGAGESRTKTQILDRMDHRRDMEQDFTVGNDDGKAPARRSLKDSSLITDDMDDKTANKVLELSEKKSRAVAEEDYDTAKECKLAIERLTKASAELKRLERDKRDAVEREDYDAAKELKLQIERLRTLSLNPDALVSLEKRGASLPSNDALYRGVGGGALPSSAAAGASASVIGGGAYPMYDMRGAPEMIVPLSDNGLLSAGMQAFSGLNRANGAEIGASKGIPRKHSPLVAEQGGSYPSEFKDGSGAGSMQIDDLAVMADALSLQTHAQHNGGGAPIDASMALSNPLHADPYEPSTGSGSGVTSSSVASAAAFGSRRPSGAARRLGEERPIKPAKPNGFYAVADPEDEPHRFDAPAPPLHQPSPSVGGRRPKRRSSGQLRGDEDISGNDANNPFKPTKRKSGFGSGGGGPGSMMGGGGGPLAGGFPGAQTVADDPDKPAPLKASVRKDNEHLIEFFGEFMIECFYSSKWQFRQRGLESLKQFIIDRKNPDNYNTLVQYSCKLLSRTVKDKVTKVFTLGITVFQTLVDEIPFDDATRLILLLKSSHYIVAELIVTLGHTNIKLVHESSEMLMHFCSVNQRSEEGSQACARVVCNELIRPMKSKLSRHLTGRSDLLIRIVQEYGIPKGIAVESLLNFIKTHLLLDKNGEVRETGVQLVSMLYSMAVDGGNSGSRGAVNPSVIISGLSDLNDFMKVTINTSIEKETGHRNVLHRSSKAGGSTMGTSIHGGARPVTVNRRGRARRGRGRGRGNAPSTRGRGAAAARGNRRGGGQSRRGGGGRSTGYGRGGGGAAAAGGSSGLGSGGGGGFSGGGGPAKNASPKRKPGVPPAPNSTYVGGGGSTLSSPGFGSPLSAAGAEELSAECNFCGFYDPSFAESEDALDLHYWQGCPMLTSCELCEQVIEISSMFGHWLHECEAAEKFELCPDCSVPYPSRSMGEHISEGRCVDGIPKLRSASNNRCPLCLEDAGSGDGGWRAHLARFPGCSQNERAPLNQDDQG